MNGNTIEIPCGDLSPRTADGTDFGEVRADGTVAQQFFSIWNRGHDTLALTGNPLIQIGGTHAADFAVSSIPDASIEVGSYDSFTIHFTPGGVGLREATLIIPNNDPDENPYVFAIQGTGILPEIAVWGNGYEITDNDSSPRSADGTDFGELSAYVETCQRTFMIHNTGTADLHLTYVPIYIELPSSPWFDVTGLPTSPVQPGGSTSFTITYAPCSAGVHDQIVSIRNDDSDENPYTFTIRGTCVTPEMRVTGNDNWIFNGNTFTAYDDLTEFGCVRVSAPLIHTFAIKNTGTELLTLTGNPPVQTSGPAAAQFQVPRTPALSVATNGVSTDFDLRFAPSSGGRMTATVEIPSNDPGSNPYTYAVAGWGLQDILDQEPVSGITATNAYVFDIVSWDWACMTLTPLSGFFDLNVYKGEQFYNGALGMSTHTLQTTDFVVLNGHLLGSGAHAAKIYGPAAGSYLVECETYVPDLTVGTTYSQYAFEANDRADMYEVNLQGGTCYRIRVESQSTDTVLYLFSPRKKSATSLDCHAFSDRGGVGVYEQIEFNAMDAGFYGILVVDQEGMGGGYDISVRTGPEINISQGLAPGGCQIANGDDSPCVEDGTDFGVTPVNNVSPLSTFVIENTGVANLMLTNTPAVRFTGADAAAFNVFQAPSEIIIEPEDYTEFRLRFSPHDSGMRTATVNIANNDGDKNPYTFAVRGFAAHQLTLDEPKAFTGVPEYANFNGEGWIAVGAKWLVSPLDLRLSASSNTTWTEEYATSDLPGNVTEFIARNLPEGASSHYIKLNGDAGDSAMEIDSDWSELVPDVSRQITMSDFDVMEMFGIELTAGTTYLAAIDVAGFLGDLDMSLFILRPDRTCGSRTDCDWSACPSVGADRAEVSFTAPVSGRYIVIVTHESDQSHTCNLLIKEKARNTGTVIKLSCVF